jgi:nucleotide-binding universal stress UspA family protein
MFCNVLVCVDGSQHSERALSEAIDIAATHRSRLTILTAVPKPPGWACASLSVVPPPTLKDELEQESRAALQAAVDRVPREIPITKILTHRPIREAIAREAETGKYDLLVMGSRGRGALTSSVLGSVSHYALNHCGIPVLIVRDDQPARKPGEQSAQTPSTAPVTRSVPRTA